MIRKIQFVFACVITFASVNLYAETVISGPGAAASCGDYVKHRREQPRMADLAVFWAQGYMSGANSQRALANQKVIDIPKFDTLGLLIESACIKNPTYNVWMATEVVSRDLLANAGERSALV